MRNLLYSLALPFLILGLGPAAVVAEVHDEAGMFRPEAVRRADVILQRVEREQRIPVRIDTIESLRGATTPEERQEWSRKTKYEVVDRLGERRAQDWGRPGLYLLISKDDRAFSNLLVHRSLERRFPATRREAIKSLLTSAFKQSQYDEGLIRVAEQIEDVAVATANQDRAATRGHAQGPVGPPMQRQRGGGGMGIIGFLILILGIFLVIRLLSGLFGAARGGYSRPGGPMGGPGGYGGYGGGGGGGGFFSGLFGGLGGALLGNWLFDRWNHPHQDAGSSSGGVLEPTGSSEPTYAPDDFAGANDDGGQGGGWGGDAGSPGDWLGGGDGGGSDCGGGGW